MRIADDHDEARAVAKFGLKGALASSVLMFSLDGYAAAAIQWDGSRRCDRVWRSGVV